MFFYRNVKTLVTNQYGTETVSQYGYGYDALGRRTSVTNSGTAFDEPAFNIYGYNSRNELTASNRYLGTSIIDTASQVNDEARAYDYDPIGNRINAQQDYDISASAPITSTYVTSSLNQYESISKGGDSISLDYDDDGNLIHKDGVQYVFNCENRLVEVAPLAPVIGDTKVAFAYDYKGRRYLKQNYVYSSGEWSLVSTSTSIWEGWNRIQEKVVLASDGSEETTSYIWGLDLSQSLQGAGGVGGLIAVVDNESEVDFFLYDANGNVGQLVNAADGTIDAAYEYDPFGRLINAQGSKANQNPYRFSTKPMDQQTGLYYYGYRYLDVDLGRWVRRDPFGYKGGINLNAYIKNSPIGLYDILGLSGGNGPVFGAEFYIGLGFSRSGKFHISSLRIVGSAQQGLCDDLLVKGDFNFRFYTDGLGTSVVESKYGGKRFYPYGFDITGSMYAILGNGQGGAVPSYTLNYHTKSAIDNNFRNSLTWGQSFNYNSNVEATRDGFIGFRADNFYFNYNNDVPEFPTYGGGSDYAWTAGAIAGVLVGDRETLELGYQDFTGIYQWENKDRTNARLEHKINGRLHYSQTEDQRGLNRAIWYLRTEGDFGNVTVDIESPPFINGQHIIHDLRKINRFEYLQEGDDFKEFSISFMQLVKSRSNSDE